MEIYALEKVYAGGKKQPDDRSLSEGVWNDEKRAKDKKLHCHMNVL